MKSKIGSKRSISYITLIICFLYVFRSVGGILHIDNASYVLTIGTIVYLGFSSKKVIKTPKILLTFIMTAIVFCLTSMVIIPNNGIIISIIGLTAIYMNFLMWLMFMNGMELTAITDYMKMFKNVLIFLGLVTAMLGIYQSFFDASIGGLANSGIYSDESALATGSYVRRATAFLGSAQNYGIFVGATFCLLAVAEKKKIFGWFIKVLILLMGVLVSGSRSASACIVIGVTLYIIRLCVQKKFKIRYLLATYIIFIPLTIILIYYASRIVDDDTFSRLSKFGISVSRLIYKNTFENMSPVNYLFGYGLGYRNWTVRQFVGQNLYYAAFGEAYASTESAFLQFLVQSGVLSVLIFAAIIVRAIVGSIKLKDIESIAVLLCLVVNFVFTPSFSGLAMSYIFWPFLIYPIITIYKRHRYSVSHY